MVRTLDLFPVLSRSFLRSWEPTFTEEGIDTFVPVAYVDEDKDFYGIEVDLPGLTKEDLKIETESQLLTISGERKGRYRVRKVFNLPDDVDLEGVQATHENGVLKLKLPKSTKSKARQITIR